MAAAKTFRMTEYNLDTMPVPTATEQFRKGFVKELHTYIKSDKEMEKIDEAANQASLEETERAIDEYVAKVTERIRKLGEETKKELPNLTPEQRKDVVGFWQGATTFMIDVLEWLQKAFTWLMDKLRAGLRLVIGSLKAFFDEVITRVKTVLQQ